FSSSRRRHTSLSRDWSSDVCSSDLPLSRNCWLLSFAGGQCDTRRVVPDALAAGLCSQPGAGRAFRTLGAVRFLGCRFACGLRSRSEERRVGRGGRSQGSAETTEQSG